MREKWARWTGDRGFEGVDEGWDRTLAREGRAERVTEASGSPWSESRREAQIGEAVGRAATRTALS